MKMNSWKNPVISYLFISLALLTFAMEDWEKWSKLELEQQMSPSRWSPTKSPEEVINEYIDVSLKATLDAKEKIPNSLDLVYGAKGQKLDLYGTDLPDNSPIFVFVHGGYWQEGAKEISGGTAISNHKIGFKTVAVGYTLAPNATIEEMEHEIIDALEYLVKKFPEAKIVIGGHSAGGQLAAHFVHQPKKPLSPELATQLVGFVLISGVYDLRPLVNTYVNEPLKLTMENALSLSSLQSSTINKNLNPQNVKILVLVGEYDSPEFIRQSKEYYNKIKSSFPSTEYYLSKSDDHFTIVQNLAQNSNGSGMEFNKFLKTVRLSNDKSSGNSGLIQSTGVFMSSILMSYMF